MHLQFIQGDFVLAKRLVVAASIALLAGCKSDSTSPGVLTGTVSFAYSGGTSGSFSANGAFNAATMETVQWAAGSHDAANDFVFVAAATPRGTTQHDFFAIEFDGDAVGAYSAESSCSINCVFLDVTLGVDNSGSGDFLFTCFLTAGTVTITEITATRVRGTFSGTGSCLPPIGSAVSFTVTNGTFDVPLISDSSLP